MPKIILHLVIDWISAITFRQLQVEFGKFLANIIGKCAQISHHIRHNIGFDVCSIYGRFLSYNFGMMRIFFTEVFVYFFLVCSAFWSKKRGPAKNNVDFVFIFVFICERWMTPAASCADGARLLLLLLTFSYFCVHQLYIYITQFDCIHTHIKIQICNSFSFSF